jgi:hypothetical protein
LIEKGHLPARQEDGRYWIRRADLARAVAADEARRVVMQEGKMDLGSEVEGLIRALKNANPVERQRLSAGLLVALVTNALADAHDSEEAPPKRPAPPARRLVSKSMVTPPRRCANARCDFCNPRRAR